jgi:DNA-binding transcriptional regulator LsrR (DeoR family)
VPELDDPDADPRAGIAGRGYLAREIEKGEARLIGVGHGRTLAACVDMMPRRSARDLRFVSLLGGLTRNLSANPHDTMHRLAEKTGAASYVMPVPFFANTAEDREVMLAQRGVREVLELAARSDLKLVGIGTAESEASLVQTGMISPEEIAEAKAAGGVGELLGHFFDAEGRPVATALSERTLSLPLGELEGGRIVAVAGGAIKTGAIRSILMSGRLTGLLTDERTAFALLENGPG